MLLIHIIAQVCFPKVIAHKWSRSADQVGYSDVIFQCVQSSLFVKDICKFSEDKMMESHNKVKIVNIIYTVKQTQRFS